MENFNLLRPDAAQKSKPPTKILRLSDELQPVVYHLKMAPILYGNFSFSGHVKINVHVNRATKSIIIHSHKLTIKSVEIFRYNRKLDSLFTVVPEQQILKISTRRRLNQGNNVEVNIAFNGTLNDQMLGFYRSSYTFSNYTKWLAVTKFEPTLARWAFPCFDEPKFRAVFNISVARYSHQRAISNMPLLATSAPDQSVGNRVWDVFQMTPPMPTYLVAFMVSEFKYVTTNGSNVKVWARENAINNAKYSLDQAITLLDDMGTYTSLPYNLPKMDVLAIPDFKAGAMENWGLTTYRERYVLTNDENSYERHKELVTSVIAHEFSHQWFGDLVTPAWWDYLWLNEGFATYFEYYLTAITEPSWRMDELFVVEVLHNALRLDGIYKHRAMTSAVEYQSDLDQMFDVINYEKSGSVIRMIRNILSNSVFQKALTTYLQTRKDAGGVAAPSHLYESMEQQIKKHNMSLPNGLNITYVFTAYSEQIGYPLVTVLRQKDIAGCNITIEQKAYKSTGSVKNVTEKTWPIPLACTKQSKPDFNNTQPTMWLVNDKKINLPNEVRKDEWYICNLQQYGYYRVNYDLENWQLIIKQLHTAPSKIHQLNRAQLLDDSYALARDNHLPMTIFLELCRYLEHEVDPIPWYKGWSILDTLVQRFGASKAALELRKFSKHLIEHYYEFIGFKENADDSHTTKTLRPSILYLASNLGVDDAVAKCEAEFFKNSSLSQIPPYATSAVICTALRKHPETSVWSRVWEFYKSSNLQIEQETVLLALGCSTNETFLKGCLFKLADENDHDIRAQHQSYVLSSVSRTPEGVLAAINFIHDVLPKMSNYTKAEDVIIKLLWFIREKVQTHEHFHRLDHVIEEAMKMDQKLYGGLTNALTSLKDDALKLKAITEKEAEIVYKALGGEEPTTPAPEEPTPKPPKPSAAASNVPHLITFAVILLSKWALFVVS